MRFTATRAPVDVSCAMYTKEKPPSPMRSMMRSCRLFTVIFSPQHALVGDEHDNRPRRAEDTRSHKPVPAATRCRGDRDAGWWTTELPRAAPLADITTTHLSGDAPAESSEDASAPSICEANRRTATPQRTKWVNKPPSKRKRTHELVALVAQPSLRR